MYVVCTTTLEDYGRPAHVELFTHRPNTPGVGGEPDNWPPSYAVYEGNPDGGDTVLLERCIAGTITLLAWSH